MEQSTHLLYDPHDSACVLLEDLILFQILQLVVLEPGGTYKGRKRGEKS